MVFSYFCSVVQMGVNKRWKQIHLQLFVTVFYTSMDLIQRLKKIYGFWRTKLRSPSPIKTNYVDYI